MQIEGLITTASQAAAKETLQRLIAAIGARGLTVFARIDHAAGASAVGLPLRPTELVIFGNAKGGTPLMQAEQRLGIELPLRTLVWQDESQRTWISYPDLPSLARRYGVAGACDATVTRLAAVLQSIVEQAAGPASAS
jgi:uncharacterized protein (DUF302 family)